jgi:hypothetical protein
MYCSGEQPSTGRIHLFTGREAFGLLVLLGFAITDFTPAAYQRHSL